MLLNAQIRKKKRKAEVKSLNFIDFLNVVVYNQKGKREFYVKPGVRRKLKSEAARKARRGKK